MHVGCQQIEIRVNLIVVAKFVRSVESLWAEVDGIEDDVVLSDKMFNDEEKGAFAERRVQDNLEVLQQLFEALNCPVAEDKLNAIFLQVLLFNLANDPLEMDDHNHLISMRLAPTKVESATLRLVDSFCFRLNAVRVVDKVGESAGAIFFNSRMVLDPVICSRLLIESLKLYLLLLILILLILLMFRLLVELDQFPLQCLAYLHLGKGLRACANLDGLHMLHVHRLREGACTRRCATFRAIANCKVVVINACSAFPPRWIIFLFFR